MALTAALRDLNKLNTFVRVAERRSFTKAAFDLRTTPSVVSKHMKELEDALGFSLFNRSTHGVVLTESGDGLFQRCLEMMSKLDDYVVDARNLQAGPFGTLRIQATDDYARWITAPLTVEFGRLHPGLRIHLSVLPDDAIPADDSFDVIIASRKPSLPGMMDQELGSIRHAICASPAYFKQFGQPRQPQDLRSHNCLSNHASGPKEWPFRSASRQLMIEIAGSLSSNNHSVLIQTALLGSGIIRVPRHAVKKELADGSLVEIFETASLSPERAWAYFSKSKRLPAKTTDFIRFLKSSIDGAAPC
jgi:DNA-binding transcriptional LysR family regulator